MTSARPRTGTKSNRTRPTRRSPTPPRVGRVDEELHAMRPQLHFTAGGWINDPHGFVHANGEYHAFYQYVPGSTEWETGIHWGHAAGPDLMSLRPRAIAIAPGDGDDGIWTGSIVDGGRDTHLAFYTSVAGADTAMGTVRVATTQDRSLDRWSKGPVVVEPPEGLGLTAFRDPFVFEDDGCWRMLVGGAMADGVAGLLSFSSVDLTDWQFDGVAASRSTLAQTPIWTGELWECPQLITVDGHDVLMFSVWAADTGYGTAYGIGRWHGGKFDVERWGTLAYGSSYYAPTVYHDADGLPCITFWMRHVADPDGAWVGAHSLPWGLSVIDGDLRLDMHGSVERLLGRGLAGSTNGRTLIHWDPAVDGDLERAADDGSWSLRATPTELEFLVDGQRSAMPRRQGGALVVVDGPILELAHAGSILGGAIPTDRSSTAQGG
ncbi:glycoside hydrolase family 32 protein [Curtobacterium sp. MCBD17_028]|nr:glycoside hydrolase family 32 protein [Curtobacterium sp. MCBD17_028]